MKSNLARQVLLVAALIVLVAAIVACQGADEPVAEPAQPATETVTAQPPTATEATQEQEQVATEEVEAEEQDSPSEQQALPTARIGLVGSDPAEVDLASGETQLVEFFAFW